MRPCVIPVVLERHALDAIRSLQRNGRPDFLARLIDQYVASSTEHAVPIRRAMASEDASALEQSGLEVCEADSGAQALELFATARPDIVVLDVIMPGLDGFATCAKLRGSVGGGRVPILIMTGLDDAESIAHAYEQGATDFITKPLNPMILSYRVRYMLRGSHTLDALIKSEARLGLAQRIAKIGNWEWRPDTNQFTASAELCGLMGIRSQDFAGTCDAFIQLVHAEDRDR